jgi:hypothetical protein
MKIQKPKSRTIITVVLCFSITLIKDIMCEKKFYLDFVPAFLALLESSGLSSGGEEG